MPRRRLGIYWRKHTKGRPARAWGDFRAFGGKQEPLIPPGDKRATTDAIIARQLYAERAKQYQQRRRNRVLLGVERTATLAEFAREHLIAKAKAGKVTDTWLESIEGHLRAAIECLGAERELTGLTVRDMERFAEWVAENRIGRGGEVSPGTQRHYLNSLSNLFRRAQERQAVPPGFNPVAAMMEKPAARRQEARWLEVPDAALLLEAARTYRPTRPDLAAPFIYPLIATFLLTGGRRAEVLGLETADLSFDRKTVTFRIHKLRRLKTVTSHRTVPLWPQLEEILRPYVFGAGAPPGRLLFPSMVDGREQMVTDLRKVLDAVAERAGWQAGDIRTKMFRHSYCAARLQTLDRGEPVSPYTVGRELGHGGDALVRRIYGHLGTVRHRAEVVEYRVEQHQAVLAPRLVGLQALQG